MSLDSTKIQIIAGPTASGKTGLGIRLAQRIGRAAIVNMDSMQLYEGLPVITAQPDAAERAQAPHLLYGILPPGHGCSAARYADMAAATIRDLQGQGITPILVGGTGLYLKVLLDGIATIPAIEEPVRAAARALEAEIGAPALHAELAKADPATAARLQPTDSQRVIRAWEVYRQSGQPLSHWQQQVTQPVIGAGDWQATVLLPPRETLYTKINLRFAQMIEQGALDEVAALMVQRLDPELPAMKAVGVPELAAHLRGELPLAEAVARGQQMTRNYAKRQLTWFRHQLLGRYQTVRAVNGFGIDA